MTKIRLLVKAGGLPMRTEITAGQSSERLGVDLVLADNLPTPSVLLADRGHDADSSRETLDQRDVRPVIPRRKSRKTRVAVDRSLQGLRTLVARCGIELNSAGRVAIRHDETEARCLGLVDIAPIRLWVRHLSTGPRFTEQTNAFHDAQPVAV